MKVLWITDYPFAHHNTLLGIQCGPIASGSWLYAAYEGVRHNEDIDLSIATVANVTERIEGTFDRSTFYVLPGGDMSNYDIHSDTNEKEWRRLREYVNPDILCIWGTESKFAYVAVHAFQGVRILVYMQGVISSIVSHYYDGVPYFSRYKTIRDWVGILTGKDSYQIFKKHVFLEKKILELADGVIVENDWCEDQCIVINNKLNVYRNNLPIRKEFYKHQWKIESIEKHSIFTNAGGVTIKGHHILFQALAIVKRIFPDVKLYIPGLNYIEEKKSIKNKTGYFALLYDLYVKHKLYENIIFTGTLTAEQMAEKIATSHIYVMPSLVENHSSSLIEAMIVGAPCISSLVGGTANLINPCQNGMLYNSLEYSSLAGIIIRLLGNDNLTASLAANTFIIRKLRDNEFGNSIVRIYHQALALTQK